MHISNVLEHRQRRVHLISRYTAEESPTLVTCLVCICMFYVQGPQGRGENRDGSRGRKGL